MQCAYWGDLTSLYTDGSCRARASPTEIKALRNMGGPANKFIMMTDICRGPSKVIDK